MEKFSYRKAIRDARQKLGLTLEALARKVKISRRHLTQIEKNERDPSDKVFQQLKRALDLAAEYEEDYLRHKHPHSTIFSPASDDVYQVSSEDAKKFRKAVQSLNIPGKDKEKLLKLISPKKSK